MPARTLLLALLATVLLSGPAFAQSGPPASLFDAAPTQDAGAATPTDGGRSPLLLALALVCVGGAGVLAGLALRRPRPVAAPVVTPVAQPTVAPVHEPAPVPRTRRFQPAERPRRFRAPRAAAAEASASARMGMPVVLFDDPAPAPAPAPAPEPEPVWRPRVHSELPPLPAFGSGAEPPPG